MTKRKAILDGIRDAKDLHQKLAKNGVQVISNGRVDIFNAIDACNIELMFGDLKNLLGFCVNEPSEGILITSARPLAIQRFTAAHELGHLYMGHHGSVDKENDIVDYQDVNAIENSEFEISANAFASEFLQPKELVLSNIKAARITSRKNLNEIAVYKLSLVMGLSYRATCWGLHTHDILEFSEVNKLASVQPKKIKEAILNDKKIGASFGNVWSVRQGENPFILGTPEDLIVVDLVEHSSSGYLWYNVSEKNDGVEVIQKSKKIDNDSVGKTSDLKIIVKIQDEGRHKLDFIEQRKWEKGNNLNELTVEGFFRFQRQGLANEVIEKRVSGAQ